MDIVNGYSDNTFRPGNLVTYNEAVKMMVCAIGFGGLAETRGDYPNRYIKTAEEIGITAGISFDGNDMVSRQDFSAMLAASLNVLPADIQNLMEIFVLPATPTECAQFYAQAVMNRNGAVQFALYDDKLKDSTRDGFMSFHWVTGVSSPWVSDFDIVQVSELEFEILFHYATSTGPSGDTIVKLLFCQIDESYKIANIK